MAETDAEHRKTPRKMSNGLYRHPGLFRSTGARGNDDTTRLQVLDLLNGKFVVPIDMNILAQFAKILHQVIGEGIVIIDHQ